MSEPIIAVMISSTEGQCKNLTRNLKPEGIQVAWFLERETAMRYCQALQPQVIILDPPLAGVELAEMIQSLHDISKDPKIPILVLSNLERSNNASLLGMGVDCILEKPFTTTAVEADIRNLVRRYQIVRKQQSSI